ncbi:fragile x mental retardation syndrome-related protein 1 [Plakobranchus ocellatus]|uniref:Fragile x mental retardation syndrome-related protein 1 n=1 Tax=Plakobranchus ocellatus TaxID=259542 RepID=A0AAV3XUG2_9GAST|nr:fragile x mental retardation syndrome-related protein 1 [Plakobranchus ocellatus]
MEYRHKTSPSPRKFKVVCLCKKDLVHRFLGHGGSDPHGISGARKYLKGHHYDNNDEVIADVRRWCREQWSEFFADGVRQLVKRWRLCVDRDGDYIEK